MTSAIVATAAPTTTTLCMVFKRVQISFPCSSGEAIVQNRIKPAFALFPRKHLRVCCVPEAPTENANLRFAEQ